MSRVAILAVILCYLAGCAQTSVTISPGGRITGAGKMLGGSEAAVKAIRDAMDEACQPGKLEWWNNGNNDNNGDPFATAQLVEELKLGSFDVKQAADVYQLMCVHFETENFRETLSSFSKSASQGSQLGRILDLKRNAL